MLVSHNATVYRIGVDEMTDNANMYRWLSNNNLVVFDDRIEWYVIVFDAGDPRENEFRRLFIEDDDAADNRAGS